MEAKIGYHIKKESSYEKSITDTIKECKKININIKNFPMQIFTNSPKIWRKSSINLEDTERTCDIIKQNDINIFIHSAYLINLARIGDEFIKSRDSLVYDLKIGKMLGAKGVVVHVGKSLKMDRDEAVLNMYNNIISIKDDIDECCPLLIETPSGQGSELLTSFEEFSNFYLSIINSGEDMKNKVKVCIDTCHIFASGVEDILDYIIRFNTMFEGSLQLIHYNDSDGACKSCVDRHKPIGEGKICINALENVLDYATSNNICMIREF